MHNFRPMLWDLKPPQFKTYPGHETINLPAAIDAGEHLDVAAIGRLLFLSGGVVRVMTVGGRPMWFRAAGSAGNLSPLELYVVTGDLPGLDAGVYHYEPVDHGLTRLTDVPAGTPPALVITGAPWRTCWKYRERGFRHLWWDAGTMLAQTIAVAEEADWPVRVELGFVDSKIAALVGADGQREVPLAVVGLGGASDLPARAVSPAPPGHLADDLVEFPLVTAAYRAGQLRSDAEVVVWRSGAGEYRSNPLSSTDGWRPPGRIDDIIRRRGSARQFKIDDVAPEELFTAGVSWSTRAVPCDFLPPGRTLLENHFIVHGVEGVSPESGDLRAEARHLCLDQPLGGDGAYTAFHCADLVGITSALGDRGYRAALVEAGIVEGRLHLAAYSLGYGATGLTFYDDEVKRFFNTPADPMLVTAVGKPAYRSRAGGLPRRPVRMVPS